MSNVIDFLERMGQDAMLRVALPTELKLVLEGEQLAPAVRDAILAGDQVALDALLGCDTICCMLLPAKEDEDEDEREDGDDPSREDEERSMRLDLPLAI